MPKTVIFHEDQSCAEVAYLAGIVDGEGCFYLGQVKQGKYGNGLQFHSMLKITSCDEALILWLEEVYGGRRDTRYRWTSKKAFCRPVFTWQATGEMLDYICPLILPCLIIKERQCRVMMRYRETSKNIGSKRLPEDIIAKRLELITEMRNLNSRWHDHPLKNPSPLSP